MKVSERERDRERANRRDGEMDIEEQWVQQTRDLFTKRAKTSAKITSVGTARKKRRERKRGLWIRQRKVEREGEEHGAWVWAAFIVCVRCLVHK